MTTVETPRTCPVKHCVRSVKPEQLMCPRHWFTVPMRLRGEVWRTWKRWRCDLDDPDLMRAYETAADSAIGAAR